MSELFYNYIKAGNTKSDINEHIPILAKYAKQCEHIIECGVRNCVSTWAFAHGLSQNGKSNKRLISVDTEIGFNIEHVKNICGDNGINYTFLHGSNLELEFEETDLLFIDTWHVYGQLKRELEKHHSKVRKYIVMHDTTVDEFIGESIRCPWLNAPRQAKQMGWSLEEVTKGIWPAIEEFLQVHPEFCLKERFINNNGLTILSRI